MDRNAKLRTTSGTTNIHQQSSPLSYHKYRELHYNIGNIKMGVNRLNAVQKATYFLKKSKVGKNEECTLKFTEINQNEAMGCLNDT